jgi:hypothetical protein
MRGETRRHDSWCGLRWTRICRKTCGRGAYGQAVWSCPPDAGVKSVEMRFRPCGRNAEIGRRRRLTSPVLRGERGAAVKPLRRECRSDFGVPVLACVRLFVLHARQWVRRAPGIPCALCFEGDNDRQKLGHFMPRQRAVLCSLGAQMACWRYLRRKRAGALTAFRPGRGSRRGAR